MYNDRLVDTVIKTKGFTKKDELWFVDLDNKSTNFKVPEFGGYHVNSGTVRGYSSYIGDRESFRDYFIENGIFTKRLPYWNTFRKQENAIKLAAYATKLLTQDYVGRKWREIPQSVVNKIKAYALSLEPLETEECIHLQVKVKHGYRVTELIVYDDNSYKIKTAVRAIDIPLVSDGIELEPLPSPDNNASEVLPNMKEITTEYTGSAPLELEAPDTPDKESLIVNSLDKGDYRVVEIKGLPGEFVEFNYEQSVVSGLIAFIEIGKDGNKIYCVYNGSEKIRKTEDEIIRERKKEWCIATEYKPGDFVGEDEIKCMELYRNKVKYIF